MTSAGEIQLTPGNPRPSAANRSLSIDSMLKDLPSQHALITLSAPGQELYEMFNNDLHLPGVLIENQGKLVGMISRETFFEFTGKIWGTEIYLSRPVGKMLSSIPHKPLILPDTMLISKAVSRALRRPPESIFQPVVVQAYRGASRILSSQILFIAQSQILTNLHSQRQYTVHAGSKMTDREAVLAFMQHNQPRKMDPGLCFKRTSVRCPRCENEINYSVIDIVRSYPEINRGITIEERMGLVVYWMYVRHNCLGEIWEIPVLHDSRLQYRSQRQPRPVERYA